MPWVSLVHHAAAWRAAWAERHLGQGRLAPTAREAEFLPAVLEIQDLPVSPVGRAIGLTIVGVMLVAMFWATVGQIDIVTVAQGKIVPSGHSKVIQPLESGVIRAIHVRDGQSVRRGDVLIELDPTVPGAELDRLRAEQGNMAVEAGRLRAVIRQEGEFQPPDGAAPAFVALQRRLLSEQLAEYQARVAAARHVIEQRKAALGATKTTMEQLEATVPMRTQRAMAFKRLVDQGYVGQLDYLNAERERVEGVQELARQRELLAQNQAALAESQKSFHALIYEFQQSRHAELSEKEARLATLNQELIKAAQRKELQRLTAPIDGVVQQLAVHTLGGVVTPAQQLLIVVPQDHPMEVEARIENKDIGFVAVGQPVEIKVETFQFTRYGLIEGKVRSISRDAVQVENGALVYAAAVTMDRSSMVVEGKEVSLSPGMNVTVEIKTGQRRLIEYFLSPLMQVKQESLRER